MIPFCLVNHKANKGDILLSPSFDILICLESHRFGNVFAKSLINNSEKYTKSYKVIAKFSPKPVELINLMDCFVLPDSSSPLDTLLFVKGKDFEGNYICSDVKEDIFGIPEHIIKSKCCEYSKNLSKQDIEELICRF